MFNNIVICLGGGLTVLVVGLLLWNQNRQQWLLNKKANRKEQLIREPKLR